MNKKDLVKEVARKWPSTRAIVDAVFRSINQAMVRKETVTIYNFGTFKLEKTKVKEVMNFYTKQRYKLEPKVKIRFIPSRSTEKVINERSIVV